jgi:hypothetical protein
MNDKPKYPVALVSIIVEQLSLSDISDISIIIKQEIRRYTKADYRIANQLLATRIIQLRQNAV